MPTPASHERSKRRSQRSGWRQPARRRQAHPRSLARIGRGRIVPHAAKASQFAAETARTRELAPDGERSFRRFERTEAGKRDRRSGVAVERDDYGEWWPTVRTASYYTFAAGCLGWNAPAAAGIALAQKFSGSSRPVVAVIGDGAFQYSIQCLATAAQHKLKVIYVVPCNGEYAILKEFAMLNTPNVPALICRRWTCLGSQSFGAPPSRRTRDGIQAASRTR